MRFVESGVLVKYWSGERGKPLGGGGGGGGEGLEGSRGDFMLCVELKK